MLKRLFHRIIEARIESAKRRIARDQLYSMTDIELRDIGIYRDDIERILRYGYKEKSYYST